MRVGGYVRLSRDEDRESYSSILSQKKIIEEYAKENNWTIVKYYEDDNHTGYSFDRPAFNELKKDLEADAIDIVIAKDLSRIGRHNASTLLFLDYIRTLDKRLILPGEGRGYDTEAEENDLLGITTWYNEMYIKDISRKIKGSMKAKQKEGKMIIKEVFGYKKSAEDKHVLEIDPIAADMVQKIFHLYVSGWGYRKIAEYLNQKGFPTPSRYAEERKMPKQCHASVAEAWGSVHVQRIIKNDIYTGTLRLAKTEKKTIKGKSAKTPLEKQFIFENNHPPIITKEEFSEAQQINDNRRQNQDRGAAALGNLFSGLLYCTDCGSYMIAYQKKGKAKCYICGNYHKHGAAACQRHAVTEALLTEAVCRVYRRAVQSVCLDGILDKEDDRRNTSSNEMLLHSYRQQQKEAKTKLENLIRLKLAEMKSNQGLELEALMQDSLGAVEADLKKKLLFLQGRIKELESELSEGTEEESGQDNEKEALLNICLQKEDIQQLIQKILIDKEGNPTIYLRTSLESIGYHIREDVN